MARSVDTSQPLSRQDFLYLRDRNRLPRAYTLDIDDESFTDADRQYARLAEKRAGREAEEQAEPEPEDEGDEYDAMSKAELQEELEDRNLPKSGNVQELRERLREDDDEEEEAEDEDDDGE